MNLTWITIFLGLVSITVVINTLLLVGAYKGFATLTTKLTEAAREFHVSSATRQWIASIHSASEQAVIATETAKQRMAELDPLLENMQARYEFTLAKIDTKVERVTSNLSEAAQCMQDAVNRPIEKFSAFTSGLQAVLRIFPGSNQDNQEE